MKTYEFESVLIKSDDINATYIEFPFDTMECFGKKGQVKVYVDVNGFEFRSSLVKMGYHCHLVGFRKEYRDITGIKVGDKVTVKIREDNDERTVEIPDDIREALLVFPEIFDFFSNMSYSHRREFILWIDSAKKEETRFRRIEKTIERLFQMMDEKRMKGKK
jgi:hypothetical protein